MPTPLPRTVKALGFVSLLTDVSSEMIYPLLPAFLTGPLRAGPALLGAIEGLAESVASLVKIGSGYLSDRLGRRKLLVVIGYGLSSMVRPLVALATAASHVLAIRVLGRLGKGVRGAPRDALVAEVTAEDERGRAFGFQRAMDHTGALHGPLLERASARAWRRSGCATTSARCSRASKRRPRSCAAGTDSSSSASRIRCSRWSG